MGEPSSVRPTAHRECGRVLITEWLATYKKDHPDYHTAGGALSDAIFAGKSRILIGHTCLPSRVECLYATTHTSVHCYLHEMMHLLINLMIGLLLMRSFDKPAR